MQIKHNIQVEEQTENLTKHTKSSQRL